MKKYIEEYMNTVKDVLNGDNSISDEALVEVLRELETKISFFQHERLIHLIVTVLFALMEIISIIAASVFSNLVSIILSFMFLVLLVPYIFHYHFLENSVQEMYRLRDRLIQMIGK